MQSHSTLTSKSVVSPSDSSVRYSSQSPRIRFCSVLHASVRVTAPFPADPVTGALVTGLVQTAWILRSLRERCPEAVAFLEWDEFTGVGRGLYLWEAFVTGKAKAATHVDDALIAATTFSDSLPNPPAANAVEAQRPMSLIGA